MTNTATTTSEQSIPTEGVQGDISAYARQGFGTPLPLKAPFGLLIIDFVNGFADPAVFGGGNIPKAISQTRQLLAHARERGHLQHGHGGQHAGHEADQPRKELVLIDGGAQHEQHAAKAGQHGQHQRHLAADVAQLPHQQGAGQHEDGDPHAAHVVQREGGGQRQAANGVEPGGHGRDADHVAPHVHAGQLGGQLDVLQAADGQRDQHADHAAVHDDLEETVMHRCEFDADRHGGEQEGGGDHPGGLHEEGGSAGLLEKVDEWQYSGVVA